jgi:hypothetical protein
MALTIAHVDECKFVNGNKRERVVDATFDSSYAVGGESLTAADVGLNKIFHVSGGVAQKSDETLAYSVAYDYTAEKLVAYEGDYDNAGDNPLIQVDDTDNLTGYSVRLRILGR